MEKKVLWIDDEIENGLLGYKLQFKKHKINYDGVTNFEAGKKLLADKLYHYDAIILDGLFYLDGEEKKVAEKSNNYVPRETALNKILNYIDKLPVKIPVFVLSGKTEIFSENNVILKTYGIDKVYIKNLDTKALCKAINELDTISIRVRQKYRSLFEILEKRKFTTKSYQTIFETLKLQFSNPNMENSSHTETFNELRKCIEELFTKYYDYGLLHRICIKDNGRPDFSNSVQFLSGKTIRGCDYVLPNNPPLQNGNDHHSYNKAYAAWHISSEKSHHTNERGNEFTERALEILTNEINMAVSCLIHLIFEFDTYVDKFPNKEINKSLWKKVNKSEEIFPKYHNQTCQINQDKKGNYYCQIDNEKLLLGYKNVNNLIPLGSTIKIEKTVPNTNKNNQQEYKIFVSEFKPV